MKCKYCESEMELEHDDILGFYSYSCLNEDCLATAYMEERNPEYIEWTEGDK